MDLLFDFSPTMVYDNDCWIGISGYRHHPDHKWNGWTVNIYLYKRILSITYVSDKIAYLARFPKRKVK